MQEQTYHSAGREAEKIKAILRSYQGPCPINNRASVKMTIDGMIKACVARQKDSKWKIQESYGRRPCKTCKTRRQIAVGKKITSIPYGIEIKLISELMQ